MNVIIIKKKCIVKPTNKIHKSGIYTCHRTLPGKAKSKWTNKKTYSNIYKNNK